MIRLQGGAFSNEGRVEVYCNGQWGTICSTGFGTTDANTICKQLGYDNYYKYNHLSISSGSSSQPIWSTNINIPSASYYYGTVRVYYNGWGNICDDSYYGSAEANVICHQLGYTGASSYSRAGLVRLPFYEMG
uniref:SRCR domain-containing protein n=1 Tax=Amphimedon queenslandica TaxID=400682 RepID=A0A1X7SDH0_AMPQE